MEESSERSRSLEINRALHTIDESHLQSFSSMEDGGDPLDRFGLDDFGQAEMIDLELDLAWNLPEEYVRGITHIVVLTNREDHRTSICLLKRVLQTPLTRIRRT